MAALKKKYDVFKGLLNGHQVNTLDSVSILGAVQAQTTDLLKDSQMVYVLHDPCDIRKPSAPKMEHIGRVLSLSKEVVYGYKTFNSVAVDVAQQGVSMLCHSLFSTELPTYVSQEALENPELLSAEKQALVADNEHINTAILYKNHLKESSEVLKKSNSNVAICHISDREFDCEEYFENITALGDSFITRLKLSRLSNETKTVFTPKGKVSKKIAYHKLVDKSFKNKSEYAIEVLEIKGKVHRNVRCVIEWEAYYLNEKPYTVVRISLFGEHKPIFEQPMLLITNQKISQAADAKAVYKGYLLRFKIEIVFKFLKTNLGWESFQVRDFESIKNLLAIGFFLIGYFKELEAELKTHPLALFLCQLANSKGKITIFFLLEGLTKLAHFQEVQLWKEENNITDQQIEEFMAIMKQ
jgi:hypothetical protein